MATVAQASYDVLRAGGLTTIFGNPGSNELKFLAAMPTDFRYVLGLHEGAVISMADGFALASAEPVLVNLHAASGSGNAMGGLTNAVYSHSPLVVTAGQQVRSTIGQEVMLANVDAAQLARPAGQVEQRARVRPGRAPDDRPGRAHRDGGAPRAGVRVGPLRRLGRDRRPAERPPACSTRSHGRVPGARPARRPRRSARRGDQPGAWWWARRSTRRRRNDRRGAAGRAPCGRRCGSRRRRPVARSRPGTRRSAACCPPRWPGSPTCWPGTTSSWSSVPRSSATTSTSRATTSPKGPG